MEIYSFLFQDLEQNSRAYLKWEKKYKSDSTHAVSILRNLLSHLKNEVNIKDFNQEHLNLSLSQYIFKNKSSISNEKLFYLLRIALSWSSKSPQVSLMMQILGKTETSKRIIGLISFLSDKSKTST